MNDTTNRPIGTIVIIFLVIIGIVSIVLNYLLKSNTTAFYADQGVSLYYPQSYTVDKSYEYQALGPGKDIGGVKFTIPASLATGTNLGSDSYISVEEIPETSNCSASLFAADESAVKLVTDKGKAYSFVTTSGAAAGNRYDETVYAFPGTKPCIAVRYFIHYAVFENFPPGSIKNFDEPALIASFDQIRRTLTINQI